jgi:hypothetical protein
MMDGFSRCEYDLKWDFPHDATGLKIKNGMGYDKGWS